MHRQNGRLRAAAAVTSAVAVIGGLGATATGQNIAHAATSAPVSFTSTPAVAPLVAHYAVTPTSRSTAAPATAAGGDSQDRLPDLQPKSPHPNRAARPQGAAAPGSDNTIGQSRSSDGHTPRPAASFIGQQGSNVTCSYFAAGCNPPDMGLAASSDFVLQGVNTQWEVLNSSGAVQKGWPVSAKTFFHVPNATKPDGTPCDTAHHSQPFLSDPRALYDPAEHRFWAAMLQVEGGLGIAPDCAFKTVYFIAVSQNSDPRGTWNVYEFDMSAGTTYAADFTQIGLNHDAVFFSANMFNSAGPGFFAEVFEANKGQMEAGHDDFTVDGFRNLQGTGPGTTAQTGPFVADTVQPVLALGASGGGDRTASHDGGSGSAGLFVDTIDGPDLLNGNFCTSATDSCKGLALWRMARPTAHDHGGPAPTLTGTYLSNTKPFYFPPPSDQPSCNACVDASDLRISATPVLRNGTIYAVWETGIDNGTQVVPGIEWAQVAIGDGGAATTSGYFNFSGDASASYPALMPDGQGNVVMVYEYMSHTTFPEVRYTPRGNEQKQFTDPGRVLKKGEASYRPTLCGTSALPVCRWGDYEAASLDESGRIWFAGEYTNRNTNPTAAPTFGRNWGTWIGAVDTGDRG
jgi:hypothetical protein